MANSRPKWQERIKLPFYEMLSEFRLLDFPPLFPKKKRFSVFHSLIWQWGEGFPERAKIEEMGIWLEAPANM
jgi:hypothetical protein